MDSYRLYSDVRFVNILFFLNVCHKKLTYLLAIRIKKIAANYSNKITVRRLLIS